MSRPNLPLITLRRGPWQAALFDPRPAPALLGGRFVQGGWVCSLQRDGRELTGAADRTWFDYDGIGLPETFESGLAYELVGTGEEYLRLGCGRLIKGVGENSERHALGRLSAVLDWEIQVGEDHAVFTTSDLLKHGPSGARIGYRLERTIRLLDDGLVSSSVLHVEAPDHLTLPLTWYAHPFFAQKRFDETSFLLPTTAVRLEKPPGWRGMVQTSVAQDAEGRWRFERSGARAIFAGVWGSREPIIVHLAGGGRLDIAPGFPLDHIVLWGSDHGASVEPKWARSCSHGERFAWDIAYRWA